MIEDKLAVEQRIRLESIAQANITHGAPMGPAAADRILSTAARYERFIRDGRDDGA